MKKNPLGSFLRGLSPSLLLFLAAPGFSAVPPSGAARMTDAAIAKVYPALVQILVVSADYQQGREFRFELAGSGVIISSDGYVITNHHVARRARRIQVILSNREKLDASLVGSDPLADIAVVKLDLSRRKDPGAALPFARFGDSDRLRVGDPVLSMGSPIALSQSVTKGIVSNIGFTIPGLFWPFTFKLDGEEVGTLVEWIGHDAVIYPGNSGGPLVDLAGEVVGINELGIGLGGAIPGNLARQVAEQIIRSGAPRRSWIGLVCQPLLRGSGRREGALISDVMRGSPAEAAGVLPGDVLLKYDGTPVNIRFAEEVPAFNRRVLDTPVGARVDLDVLRDGKPLSFSLTTVLREPMRGEERELKAWGITARQLTTLSAAELKRKDASGAFVSSVRPAGPAGQADPEIDADDVITEVAGRRIESLAHLEKVTAELVAGRTKPVPTVVGLERGDEKLVTVVDLGVAPDDERPGEVNKAWLPVAIQVVTPELARALKISPAKGVRITQVYPNSSAERAGLKEGDVLTRLDGRPIEASRSDEIDVLPAMIRQYKIGSVAELTVLRGPDLASLTVSVPLEERPVPASEVGHYEDRGFGFEARDVTYMDRVKQDWGPAQAGAVVVSVESGGWAALGHLAVGDLALEAGGRPVKNAAELEARMNELAASKARFVSLLVRRGVHTLFVELEPVWPEK